MYEIPTSIELNNKTFAIRNKGDYRMVLDCIDALEDVELSPAERRIATLIIFFEDVNTIDDLDKLGDLQKALEEVFKFINCGQDESPGAKVNYKLIDWQKDSHLISSAINKVANTEIRALPYLHWWTFIGYYLAIGESALSTVVSIRNKLVKGIKLEKYEQKFKQENPQYFIWDARRTEQKEDDELIRQLWNSGK